MGSDGEIILGTALMGGAFFLFLDFFLHPCGHRWISLIDNFDPKCGKFSGILRIPGSEGQPQRPQPQEQQRPPSSSKTQTGSPAGLRTGTCATNSQAIGAYANYNIGGQIACCYKAFCYNKNAGKPFCMCSPNCADSRQEAINYCNTGGGGGISVPPRPPAPPRQVPQTVPSGLTNTFPCQTAGGTKYVKDRPTCCKTYGLLCPDQTTRVCYGDPCPKGAPGPIEFLQGVAGGVAGYLAGRYAQFPQEITGRGGAGEKVAPLI